jgi:HPr kinase/phosphorylase
MSAQTPHNVHASALVIGEAGVLIRGPSGAGKSTLALAMVEAARQCGLFARLIGDDRVLLSLAHSRVIARPHPAIAGRIEKRGEGIVDVEYEPGAVLWCVIDLAAGPENHVPRMPSPHDLTASVEGVDLPRLTLAAGVCAHEGARRALSFIAKLD